MCVLGHNFLAKGHLTAKADFFYNAEQQSTFFYINSVPQWQTFNGYNWFYLERDLRNYAANNYVELTVYTGTYGKIMVMWLLTSVSLFLLRFEIYRYFCNRFEKL